MEHSIYKTKTLRRGLTPEDCASFYFTLLLSNFCICPIDNPTDNPPNCSLSSMMTSSTTDTLSNLRESTWLSRTGGIIAFIPIFCTMLSHAFLVLRRQKYNWIAMNLSIFFQAISKLISIPLGLSLIVAGIVIAYLDLTLTGTALLAVVYTADIGSWDAAYRLFFLLHWPPCLYTIPRWHVDPNGQARVFKGEDQYQRVGNAIQRLVKRANTPDIAHQLRWHDELCIALLAVKFVCLSDHELDWREAPEKRSVREILANMGRWEAGWNGQPGKWIRIWTYYEPDLKKTEMCCACSQMYPMQSTYQKTRFLHGEPHTSNHVPSETERKKPDHAKQRTVPTLTNYEWSLRFVIALYECIARSGVRSNSEKVKLLDDVLQESRDELEGSMKWFPTLLRNCLAGDDRALEKTVGNVLDPHKVVLHLSDTSDLCGDCTEGSPQIEQDIEIKACSPTENELVGHTAPDFTVAVTRQ